jgi:hypothetical protein
LITIWITQELPAFSLGVFEFGAIVQQEWRKQPGVPNDHPHIGFVALALRCPLKNVQHSLPSLTGAYFDRPGGRASSSESSAIENSFRSRHGFRFSVRIEQHFLATPLGARHSPLQRVRQLLAFRIPIVVAAVLELFPNGRKQVIDA